MRLRTLTACLISVLPSGLHRRAGRLLLGWDVHPTAYVGRSVIDVKHLYMGPGAAIGSFNVIKGLDELRLDAGAAIGFFNWISAPPSDSGALPHAPGRRPALVLGEQATVLQRHFIDCSDTVTFGPLATLAGVRSTILTHGINLANNRQRTAPVSVGERSAVMSNVLLLSGASVPAQSVVSAGAVVTGPLTESHILYAGNPATAQGPLTPRLGFFRRTGPAL